ncbi:MAG: hypothetical protein KKC25_08280, partial [Proteobacteria bacterium]|nr:hypothetical protein [Pseudomonadota bacterium]
MVRRVEGDAGSLGDAPDERAKEGGVYLRVITFQRTGAVIDTGLPPTRTIGSIRICPLNARGVGGP